MVIDFAILAVDVCAGSIILVKVNAVLSGLNITVIDLKGIGDLNTVGCKRVSKPIKQKNNSCFLF